MKIVHVQPAKVLLSKLPIGQVFEWNQNLYLKIGEVGEERNVFHLTGLGTVGFTLDYLVIDRGDCVTLKKGQIVEPTIVPPTSVSAQSLDYGKIVELVDSKQVVMLLGYNSSDDRRDVVSMDTQKKYSIHVNTLVYPRTCELHVQPMENPS